MISRCLLKAALAGSLMALSASALYAATPKFLITPVTTTQFNITSDDGARVQYTVTNQTKLTRTLTMVPVNGLTQTTQNSTDCANPFTLSPNQSCVLTLQVNPSATGFNIVGGPEICKTKIGTNTPDPFLCSQPSVANQLSIVRRQSRFRLGLTASPSQLAIPVSTSAQMTITNSSFVYTATNVSTNFANSALASNVSVDSSNCTSLAPRQSCVLTFTANSNAISLTSFAITSSNENIRPIGAAIEVTSSTAAPLTITGSPLVFIQGTSATLTITNSSTTGQSASNLVAAGLPAGVTLSTNNCNVLAPGASCTMIFNATAAPISLSTFFIGGTNAAIATAAIAVNTASQATLAITSGNPMTLTAAGLNSTVQTMTIQNTSSSVTATDITVPVFPSPLAGAVQLVSNTCQSVAPGASCQLGFQANTAQAATTNFAIQGTNTQAVVATITVNPVNFAYTGNSTDTGGIARCDLSTSNGALSNCGLIAGPFGTIGTNGGAGPVGLAINASNSYLYVQNYTPDNAIAVCAITPVTGALSCTYSNVGLTGNIQGMTINPANTFLYVGGNNGAIYRCPITANGSSVSSCTGVASAGLPIEQITMNADGTYLYVVGFVSGVRKCEVTPSTGAVGACSAAAAPADMPATARGIAISSDNSSYSYITGKNTITGCQVSSGDFTECTPTTTTGPTISQGADLKLNATNSLAYIVNNTAYVSTCTVSQGVASNCAYTAASTQAGQQVACIALLQ